LATVPELPEVESLARFLAEQCDGRTIERVELAAISALKTYDPPLDALAGLSITGAARRGKFLCLRIEPYWLVLHLARGGWVKWVGAMSPGRVKPGKGPLALRVRLSPGNAGFDVTEAGTEKRLAAYVVRSLDEVPGIAALGPEVLDMSTEDFAAVLKAAGNQQIKGVLTEQSLVAGVGNAYSDEALHLARLSPFKQAAKLSPEEVERLHAALHTVLRDAVERSKDLPASGLKSEKKSGLRVHGRTGQPCPECGDTVREVSFATKSLQYCPTCQTGGKPLADRRLSRLLK
jgi:formamidopyrimidine-DNA glycosylase